MKIEVGEITIAMEQRGSGRPIVVIHSWSADQRHMIADLEPILGGTLAGCDFILTCPAMEAPRHRLGSAINSKCLR